MKIKTPLSNRAHAGYHAIPLAALQLDKVASFSLYIQPQKDGAFVLYREENLPFDSAERERLLDNGVAELFVPDDGIPAYHRYLEENLGPILSDPALTVNEKSSALYGALRGIVEDVFTDPRAATVLPRSREVVQHTCFFLETQAGALQSLMQVCVFDYSTFTHSVNVFVFAMALGHRVFPPELLRNEFGLGALLHDIGKSRIPPHILNCPGKLSSTQFEIMKRHVVYGYDMLKEAGVDPLVLDMARNHHERMCGGGYPDNLRGNKIRKETRCITIADVFDALTTKRSYKDAMDSFKALQLMRDTMYEYLDPKLFDIFVRMLGESQV